MGFELVNQESQSLPPIQTLADVDAKPLKEDPLKPTSDEEVELHTPKSEEHAAKPELKWPPAPRKPRPVKRKSVPPPNNYYPVPGDLASLFIPLPCPCPCPVNKKIRVARLIDDIFYLTSSLDHGSEKHRRSDVV